MVDALLQIAFCNWVNTLDSTEELILSIVSFSPLQVAEEGSSQASAEIVFRASNDLVHMDKLSYKTLQTIESQQPFDGNPLYAILHEPIYCQRYVYFLAFAHCRYIDTLFATGEPLNGLLPALFRNTTNFLGRR